MIENGTSGLFTIRGTKKQVECMLWLLDREQSWNPAFRKYFHVWILDGSGKYYFPKEKYFESYDGEPNYAVALLKYGGRLSEEDGLYGR